MKKTAKPEPPFRRTPAFRYKAGLPRGPADRLLHREGVYMMDLLTPKDPQARRKGFYVLLDQRIGGEPQPDGKGRHPFFLDGNRLAAQAGMVGGVSDEGLLGCLADTKGFCRLVHSIGVSVQAADRSMPVVFSLIFYGMEGMDSGNSYSFPLEADGAERILPLPELHEADLGGVPGQFLFALPTDQDIAAASVKLYLNDGFDAPETDPDPPVDMGSGAYREMIARSFLSGGNNFRVKQFLQKLRSGQRTAIAYLGGSITQGAGAAPLQDMCYAWKSFAAIRRQYASQPDTVRYVKAGVGGTPSQLGILRYDRDVGRDGEIQPDLVIIEFAVNDEDDETKGVCYESLIRKILDLPQNPAIILLFSVFANDWNLKNRLAPIGFRYQLPMSDVLEAVSPQFARSKEEGRILSKRQYFYDVYHPSNIGHQVMSDCLLYLLDRLDQQAPMPSGPEVPPLYGIAYAGIRLLDKKDGLAGAKIDPGSFTLTDCDLQAVPLDHDSVNTPQFPYNWKKGIGTAPFILEITCKSLMLIFKDSGDRSFGKAQVWTDGILARVMNPKETGWTHCHSALLIQSGESKYHRIEIAMAPEDEDKTFTILGFGYVL